MLTIHVRVDTNVYIEKLVDYANMIEQLEYVLIEH